MSIAFEAGVLNKEVANFANSVYGDIGRLGVGDRGDYQLPFADRESTLQLVGYLGRKLTSQNDGKRFGLDLVRDDVLVVRRLSDAKM